MATYNDTIEKYAVAGTYKAMAGRERPLAFLVGAILAGAYVSLGVLVMFTVSAHVPAPWNHLLMGGVFGSAPTIVIFAGSELFTGSVMYVTFSHNKGLCSMPDALRVLGLCLAGNLAGTIFAAVLMHLAGNSPPLVEGRDVFFASAQAKMDATALQLVIRDVLANWMVCICIWMCGRTNNDGAKIFLIFWPILIFGANGFEHSIANMFLFAMVFLGDHPDTLTYGGRRTTSYGPSSAM